jgi:hypothetical protein
VAFALGVLGVIGPVRGPRGRVGVPLTAILASFSAIQLSGMLLHDDVLSAAADTVTLDQATTTFDA